MAEKTFQPSLQTGNIEQALKQFSIEDSDFPNGDLDARERLIASARQLVAVAETPSEPLVWNIWALPTRAVAARIAVDLKIFETAVQDNGRLKSNSELAAPTGASPALVKHITRTCASMGILKENGPGLYESNALTTLLARPEYAAGIIFWSVPS